MITLLANKILKILCCLLNIYKLLMSNTTELIIKVQEDFKTNAKIFLDEVTNIDNDRDYDAEQLTSNCYYKKENHNAAKISFFNGKWGVGKTYFLENHVLSNSSNYWNENEGGIIFIKLDALQIFSLSSKTTEFYLEILNTLEKIIVKSKLEKSLKLTKELTKKIVLSNSSFIQNVNEAIKETKNNLSNSLSKSSIIRQSFNELNISLKKDKVKKVIIFVENTERISTDFWKLIKAANEMSPLNIFHFIFITNKDFLLIDKPTDKAHIEDHNQWVNSIFSKFSNSRNYSFTQDYGPYLDNTFKNSSFKSFIQSSLNGQSNLKTISIRDLTKQNLGDFKDYQSLIEILKNNLKLKIDIDSIFIEAAKSIDAQEISNTFSSLKKILNKDINLGYHLISLSSIKILEEEYFVENKLLSKKILENTKVISEYLQEKRINKELNITNTKSISERGNELKKEKNKEEINTKEIQWETNEYLQNILDVYKLYENSINKIKKDSSFCLALKFLDFELNKDEYKNKYDSKTKEQIKGSFIKWTIDENKLHDDGIDTNSSIWSSFRKELINKYNGYNNNQTINIARKENKYRF